MSAGESRSSSSAAPAPTPVAATSSSTSPGKATEESKTETAKILSPAESEVILAKFTVADLKGFCTRLSLPVSGTKAVLIQRLMASNRLQLQRDEDSGKSLSHSFIHSLIHPL
jgi:hypothetical protein